MTSKLARRMDRRHRARRPMRRHRPSACSSCTSSATAASARRSTNWSRRSSNGSTPGWPRNPGEAAAVLPGAQLPVTTTWSPAAQVWPVEMPGSCRWPATPDGRRAGGARTATPPRAAGRRPDCCSAVHRCGGQPPVLACPRAAALPDHYTFTGKLSASCSILRKMTSKPMPAVKATSTTDRNWILSLALTADCGAFSKSGEAMSCGMR